MKKRFKKEVISLISTTALILALGIRNQFTKSESLINDIKIILSKLSNISTTETFLVGTLIMITGMITIPVIFGVIIKKMEKNRSFSNIKKDDELNDKKKKKAKKKYISSLTIEDINKYNYKNPVDDICKNKMNDEISVTIQDIINNNDYSNNDEVITEKPKTLNLKRR